MTKNIPFIDGAALIKLLPYTELIPTLKRAFQQKYIVPQRHHHDYKNPSEGVDSTLLLMPAWQEGKYLGVKMVTVSPNNGKYDLPAIQGVYILNNAQNGLPLAYMEAKVLTTRRTAAASALASSFLSKPNSSSLLMVGTGALSSELIRAHATVRPIQEVYVWGRNFAKAQQIQQLLKKESFTVKAVKTIQEVIQKVDIISCATLSEKPLILGDLLLEGQHVDLVGSFKSNMREADDQVIDRASVFVDILEGATKESGDIIIPLEKGIIKLEDIKGDLFSLCKKEIIGRKMEAEITCFKSVGYALEDLAAAILAYDSL